MIIVIILINEQNRYNDSLNYTYIFIFTEILVRLETRLLCANNLFECYWHKRLLCSYIIILLIKWMRKIEKSFEFKNHRWWHMYNILV